MLAMVRGADRLPWPDLSTAMAEEYRAIGLGRRAGAEGERLVAAIMDETERLFSAEERRSMPACDEAPGDRSVETSPAARSRSGR
jgi:hypothetical protein